MMGDYVKAILGARVYELASVTPLQCASQLSQKLGNRLFLKREDLQSVFSFKLRGAYNKMAKLASAQRARGVICASAGNHAQGVALSAAHLDCRALIVMPSTTPQVKVDAVRRLGGSHVEIVLFGQSYTDAQEHAYDLGVKRGLTFVHPFDDPDVIAGQGTIGMEVLHQHRDPIHAIFVGVGGGGLIAGIGAYVKSCRPDIRIIGVQTVDSDAMARSLQAEERVTLSNVGLFSDGTAVRCVGRETFRIAREVVDEIILVDTDALCDAIKDVFNETRNILEPAGALGVAGAKAYLAREKRAGRPVWDESLVAIAGGANIDFERLGYVAGNRASGSAMAPGAGAYPKSVCEV